MKPPCVERAAEMSAVILVEPVGITKHAAAQSQHISKANQSGQIVAVLAISDSPEAARREKPRAIHMAPVTATGEPKPQAPSKKTPNENASSNRCKQRSLVRPPKVVSQGFKGALLKPEALRLQSANDGRDVRFHTTGCNQNEKRYDRDGRGNGRPRRMTEWIINLVPHGLPARQDLGDHGAETASQASGFAAKADGCSFEAK